MLKLAEGQAAAKKLAGEQAAAKKLAGEQAAAKRLAEEQVAAKQHAEEQAAAKHLAEEQEASKKRDRLAVRAFAPFAVREPKGARAVAQRDATPQASWPPPAPPQTRSPWRLCAV